MNDITVRFDDDTEDEEGVEKEEKEGGEEKEKHCGCEHREQYKSYRFYKSYILLSTHDSSSFHGKAVP